MKRPLINRPHDGATETVLAATARDIHLHRRIKAHTQKLLKRWTDGRIEAPTRGWFHSKRELLCHLPPSTSWMGKRRDTPHRKHANIAVSGPIKRNETRITAATSLAAPELLGIKLGILQRPPKSWGTEPISLARSTAPPEADWEILVRKFRVHK